MICELIPREIGFAIVSFAERLLVTAMDSSSLFPDRADFQGMVVSICFNLHSLLRTPRRAAPQSDQRGAVLCWYAVMAVPHLSFPFHVRPIQTHVLPPNPPSQGLQEAAGGNARRLYHPL